MQTQIKDLTKIRSKSSNNNYENIYVFLVEETIKKIKVFLLCSREKKIQF